MSALAPATDITIRETRPEDTEEILLHRRQMFHDMGHKDDAVLEALIRGSRGFIAQGLREGFYRGWFAVDASGQVAAGVGLLITPWVTSPFDPEQPFRAYLLNVYTYPEFRKRGLARLLTEQAIAYCRKRGLKVLWLHASEHGRPLYESLGFESTNEMKLVLA
jgi:ribosomal protein S18 acetylase RimI-like enzyme